MCTYQLHGMKTSILWLLLAALTLTVCTPDKTAVPLDVLVIRSSTIIDGTDAPPLTDGVVIVQGERIWAVGPAATFDIPTDATVLDVGEQTVLPGIIDAHVHFSSDVGTRRAFLVAGVTSVCDLGTTLHSMPAFSREVTHEGLLTARGWIAGPILTAPGGYPATVTANHWDYPIRGPEAAKTAVADLIARGADMIKIALEPGPRNDWPLLTAAEIEAIVDTAHANDVPVRAHIHRINMLKLALDAGVDAVEHIPLPFCLETDVPQLVREDRLTLAAWPTLLTQYQRMADYGVVLVPTLCAHCCITHDLMSLSEQEQDAADAFMLALVRHFYGQGGTLALGTDYGTPGIPTGMPLQEMELLLAADVSPMDVLLAATRHAAEVCGQGEQLGTLEPGKVADLIVVDGDPLADVHALSHVTLVIKNGVIAYARP